MDSVKRYLSALFTVFAAVLPLGFFPINSSVAATLLGDDNPVHFAATVSNYAATAGEFFITAQASQAATAKALNINVSAWQFAPAVTLTLRSSTGLLLAQGTVTAGATGVRSVSIPDVPLMAGNTYILGFAVQSGYLKPFQKQQQYVTRNDSSSQYATLANDLNETAGTSANNIPHVWVTGEFAKAHGDLRQITVAGAGAKQDYNTGNYTFSGHRHMHHRFTDFANATTATPASNTTSGWKAHLDGIYPIVISKDFNSQALESGATLQLTGGPTPSGKWLKRQLTNAIATQFPNNYRLRNFNLSDNDGSPTARDAIYVSFYLQTFESDDSGKFFRMFLKDSPLAPKTTNIYPTKAPHSGQFTWRAEGNNDGWPIGYADQTVAINNQWNRIELLLDFANDRYAFMVNGILQTDISRGYMGWVAGQLGVGTKHDYSLLGNTVTPFAEDGHHMGWAQPQLDFSLKRIEIADSANWETKTKAVLQPVKSWSNDAIEFIVNQGDFPDLQNKHIFYVDGTNAVYVAPL